MYRTSQQPVGQTTRGKTAPRRLRAIDAWISAQERHLLVHGAGAIVDLGFGRLPVTTVEMARRLWLQNADLRVTGVEIEADRVAAARSWRTPRLQFVRGGFDVDVGPARLIRAMNVLRQYDEGAVPEAWRLMGQRLTPGGLLVEGTCNPDGSVLVAHLLRRTAGGLHHEGVLFHTNFKLGFEPAVFQPVLPKRLIHRMVPGEAVHAFFEAWNRAYLEARPLAPFGPRQVFVHTARILAATAPVDRRRWLPRRGYLLWRTADPVIPAPGR